MADTNFIQKMNYSYEKRDGRAIVGVDICGNYHVLDRMANFPEVPTSVMNDIWDERIADNEQYYTT